MGRESAFNGEHLNAENKNFNLIIIKFNGVWYTETFAYSALKPVCETIA